jgi:hypothetical protein
MKVGTEMGGLEWEEHENLKEILKKGGWRLRRLNVETMDGLVTGIVTLQVVQEKVWEEYEKTYFPLEDSEYHKGFCVNLRNKKK